MANKPFTIQGADLKLGGVNLQAGATTIVIPGVTQAVNYFVEEVVDRGDQTVSFQTAPILIDYVTYLDYQNNSSSSGRAEYSVDALDDEGYIEDITIDAPGEYTSSEGYNSGNDLFAYTGTDTMPGIFTSFVDTDWTQIPFRPKMRAGNVEVIGGSGGTDATVSYKGFRAVYARMYDSEPTISKVLIYQDTVTTTPTLEVDTDTSRDLFKVSGLANSSVIALVNIYGSDDTHPTPLSTLQHFAKSIIDNVILSNGNADTNIDVYDMRSRFYDNFDTFASRAGNRYKNFKFTREEWLNIPGTGGSGTGATFNIYRDRHDDTLDNVQTGNSEGVNYQVNDVITVLGTALGGTAPANNIVITVTEVGGSGQVSNWTYAGTPPNSIFPLDSIEDGGTDQYDGANYIFTNIQGDSYIAYNDDETAVSERVWAVNYNGGNVNESGAAWFGAGGEYVATYKDSIFGLFVDGANINWIATNGNSGFDGDGIADTGSLQLADTDGLINGDQTFVLNADGSVTFPDGTTQTTAYTEGDPNVWVQDFETMSGTSNEHVGAANSVEYLANGDIVAVFLHFGNDFNSRYNSIGRFTPTGERVWSMKFQGALYTDGWGLAVDNNSGNGYIYVAGEKGANTGYDVATLTKLNQIDGSVVWSKTYDVGYNNSNVVVDVGPDGHPVVVGYASNGTDDRIVTTKINSGTGAVIWSKAINGQGDDQAYGMAVDNNNNGEVVTVGYIAEFNETVSHGVTPLTGSTTDVLVIDRSDLSGDTLTNTWTVSGTGITGTASIGEINIYNALTGTVQQGSGATFNFVIAGDGSITNPVNIAEGGINYLVGHKIKIPYTSIGGADANSDIILTVTGATDGAITSVAAGYFGGGAGSPNNYWSTPGTNYNVGSGLSFDFVGDSNSTYTEHTYNIFAGGTNYVTGDTVTIPGAQLGGTTPENNLIATVSAVDGVVTGFNTFTGTQQTVTYRISVIESVDFSGVGTWTLSGTTVDQDDRMVVIKYANDGTIEWQQAIQVEPGYNCTGADADIDNNGNIYVCGNFDYDNNGGTDSAMIIIKLNRLGNKMWTRKVQGPCDDFASSIVVGPDDCLYLSAFTSSVTEDYSMVIAKYNLDGTVAWQRLLDNTTTWTFAGSFFFGPNGFSGSTLAVREGYVAVVGGFGDPFDTMPRAIVAQFDTDGRVFTRGTYDFQAATFSGLLNTTASNITVDAAGKTASDYAGEFTVGDFAPSVDLASDLMGTVYRKIIADNELRNGVRVVALSANGSVTLPAGGTVSEGYVTSNPTIQLTPARPDVDSQKLVIKGGGTYWRENGISVSVDNITRTVGQTLTVSVTSDTYAGQTLYWWINPEGVGIGDTESGTVTLNGMGFGSFSILIDSDDYEFNVRVSPEDHNYGPGFVGAQSILINGSAPTFDYEHHLHLTTGDLTETSIFLGTDNHNVRTNTDGSIQITSTTYGAVDSIDSSTSQGGYNTGTYTGLTTTGGSGTGLTVNATSTGGYIDFVTIVNPGTGYTNGDVLTLVGGDGLGCTLNIIVLGISEWKFNADGTTTFPTLTVPIEDNATPTGTGQVLQFSDSTQQAIIFGPVSTAINTSAERVIIQGAPGYTGTNGEGGDVYVWAGPGGSANGGGGDIKVRAGEGIGSGQGGYLNFQAGDSATGTGGYINIESGSSNTIGEGGYVDIRAQSGGDVNVYTGQAGTIGLNTEAGALTVGGVTAQVGSSIVIATGSAYGDTAVSIASDPTLATTYPAGSTITFQDGEVRTITGYDNYPGGTDIFWTTAKTGTLFPIILKTANYVAEVIAPTSITVSANTWTFSANGSLTFPDATVQTTALVQGEQIFTLDTGAIDYAPTAVDFNLLLVLPAGGYSSTDPTSVTLPNGVPGQRLVIFNGYSLATLTVNPGPAGRDISGGVVAEFIFSSDGWIPLYGTNSPT